MQKVKKLLDEEKWSKYIPEHKEIWERMVKNAHELHKLVKPKHHKYMKKNRRCDPGDPEFYNHIHPIEDLLAFMDNPHANNDPEDKTIDHEFIMKIYTRRWGHDDKYKIKRTGKGWYVSCLGIRGECNKNGRPYLFDNLEQDGVNYPANLSDYLYCLWNAAEKKGLTHKQVQNAFDSLTEWINKCEAATPEEFC